MVGVAAGKSQVLVKELEGVGEGQEHTDGDGGHHIGDFHLDQGLPAGGAVDPGGLNQRAGDGLKTCNVNDHHVTDLLPAHQNNHAPVAGLVVQSQQRLSGNAQHAVDEDVPDVAQHDAADEVGHEVDGTEHIGALDTLGQSQSHGKGQHIDEDGGHHREGCRKAQGSPELGILKYLHIVADSHPGCLVDGGELAEGQVQPLAEGNDEADDKG